MNTLTDKKVLNTLAVLHEKADADQELRSKERQIAKEKGQEIKHAWATAYSAVGAEEGHLLYFLATASQAKNIVEFGCSFGISTIYLAAAAKNNGGKVITTDFEPNKVAGAQENIKEAGLEDFVTILVGDALQTLASVERLIDFLFLDGAKDLYLPLFDLLYSKLSKNAIIVADNANQEGARPFVDYILKSESEFTSILLFNKRVLISYRN
ncbi:O-methyltransferase [Acinetobacter populi]|uniref:Methyltransferase n=1 Tax=Acinetobacter populi TaxID=1582270 RepID=A0A1Z9Z407_9GAMM|nr:class I SAM-dependent methyltransferase [Acinetobacter populi]OUY09180.1 hypothetical protein CAP51_06190 [Acinetobacter populi]